MAELVGEGEEGNPEDRQGQTGDRPKAGRLLGQRPFLDAAAGGRFRASSSFDRRLCHVRTPTRCPVEAPTASIARILPPRCVGRITKRWRPCPNRELSMRGA